MFIYSNRWMKYKLWLEKYICTIFSRIVSAETIFFWKLECGKYSREETIQGRKLLIIRIKGRTEAIWGNLNNGRICIFWSTCECILSCKSTFLSRSFKKIRIASCGNPSIIKFVMEKLTRIHLYVLLFFCFFALRQLFKFTHIISAEIIQGRKLFKGGNY